MPRPGMCAGAGERVGGCWRARRGSLSFCPRRPLQLATRRLERSQVSTKAVRYCRRPSALCSAARCSAQLLRCHGPCPALVPRSGRRVARYLSSIRPLEAQAPLLAPPPSLFLSRPRRRILLLHHSSALWMDSPNTTTRELFLTPPFAAILPLRPSPLALAA